MYYLEKLAAQIIIFLFTRFQLIGRENVPSQGPLLVLANHLSVSDPVILGTKIGRRITFMAKEELFRKNWQRYFVRSFGAFPVYHHGLNRAALRQAAEVLKRGQVLGMFPEGKRSHQNRLMPALYGSALIAYHNHVPILPVAIYGTEAIRGFNWVWRRPRVTMIIGKPFHLPVEGQTLNKENLAYLTDIIMVSIAQMLPENYRGQYQEKSKCPWKLKK